MIKISALLTARFEGLPPTVNQMYRTGRTGTRYKKPEVQEWQDSISAVLRRIWDGKKPYTGDVGVIVKFTVNTKRQWDIDNRLKALFDCLEYARVIHNDNQIAGIQADRQDGNTSSTYIEVYDYQQRHKKS